jgi:hypothetical protein
VGFIEAVLALIGLVTLIGAVVRWQSRPVVAPSEESDVASPYREGLHAAVHMQRVAQDLEQQIYAAAAQHDGDTKNDEGTSERP